MKPSAYPGSGATIAENKYIIDLSFKPSIVEFEGFVNYGSPIQSTGVGSDGKPMSLTLTENRIEQPIFSKRSVETSLFIYDGHTVAIGGLITENVQTVEDKVPIFGDLPLRRPLLPQQLRQPHQEKSDDLRDRSDH